MFKKVSLILCLLFSPIAMAWTPNGEISKVVNMIQWNDNYDVVVILESGLRCYIPANEITMISFVLSLYVSQKDAQWHCYDATIVKANYDTHKLHRVIGQ